MIKVLMKFSRLFFGGLMLMFLLAGSFRVSSAQEEVPTWLDNLQNPFLEAGAEISRSNFSNAIKQGFNPPCYWENILTREFVLGLPLWRQSVNSCWQTSSLGLLSYNGGEYLMTNGSHIAGKFTNIPSSADLSTTPLPDVYLEQKTTGSTTYAKYHFNPKVETTSGPLGTVSHTLNSNGSMTLENSANNAVLPKNINYSRSGKWMVAHAHNYALMRINLESHQLLNFGYPVPQGAGLNPNTMLSISEDGRYVATVYVAAGTSNQWLRVYDLKNCQSSEASKLNVVPADCPYRDFTTFLRQNIPNFYRISMAEFGDNDTLVFYHEPADPNASVRRYKLQAPNSPEKAENYIALGDSFASGEGAYNYFRGTNEGSGVNNCHLSKASYPYLLGKRLGIQNYHSVACSGARIRNVNGSASLLDPELKEGTVNTRTNQYKKDVPGNELGDWLPGYYPQIGFIRDRDADVVTISMIGNDIGFGEIIKKCVGVKDCYSTYEDRVELLHLVYSQFDTLVSLFGQIKITSSPTSRIYALGYPKIGNPDGDCALNVRLSRDELRFANGLVERLNYVIQQASLHAGVKYVSLEDSLDGFGFCENKHYTAINGLTVGDDILEIIGNESYHPNKFGHELFMDAIWEQSRHLTAEMPTADIAITKPTQETDLDFLNIGETGREVRKTDYKEELTSDVVIRDKSIDITLDSNYTFMPNSQVKAQLWSTPTDLGTYQANSSGGIDIILSIPPSVPIGFHTLHLFGENLLGEKIDIQKIVYVANSEEDLDGDGVNDIDEPCGVFEASGQDEDNDGMDDACDGLIDLSLVQEEKQVNDRSLTKSGQVSSVIFVEDNGNPTTNIEPSAGVLSEIMKSSNKVSDLPSLNSDINKPIDISKRLGTKIVFIVTTLALPLIASFLYFRRSNKA